MSCHRRPDVRAFLDSFDPILGVEFGEPEWHAVRRLVESVSGRSLSRARADGVDALAVAAKLSRSLRLLPVQEEFLFGSVSLTPHLRGTLDCFEFIADFGAVPTIDAVFAEAGPRLVRDFLGRHLTLDGEWLVERAQGERPGLSDGWRVVSRRPEAVERAVFPSLNEARAFVLAQPAAPYAGARRIESSTRVLTTVCRFGHVANLPSEMADADICPVCGDNLAAFPAGYYTAQRSLSVDQIEAFFADMGD